MKRKILFIVVALLLTLGIGQVVVTADSTTTDITRIRVDGNQVKESDIYSTTKSLIDIRVDYINANTIKLGSLSQSVSESVYQETVIFEDYSLKAGINNITIQAVGPGTTVKKNLSINYISSFVSGTQYVTEIPSTGKVSIFDKTISLTFPKNNFIIDDEEDIITNQKLSFRVTELDPDNYPSRFRTPVSNIIDIQADDSHGEKLKNPGTIAITYNQNTPDFSSDTVTIMYKEGSSDWVNIGAVVNAKNRTATAVFNGFGKYGVFNASRFFNDYNWAKLYAEPLWAKGIMQIRDEDGDIIEEDFDEDTDKLGLKFDCVRADFASMMVKALGFLPVDNPGSDSRFKDLTGLDSEDKRDIETAAAYGIVQGVKVDEFNPTGSITRAQAAVIIARVLKLQLITDEDKVAAELKKVFTNEDDFNNIPDWSRPYVLACVKAKYFNGITQGDGSGVAFEANSKLTRDQAAKLVYLVMKAQKRI